MARLAKNQQITMQRKLRVYFERSQSASFASQETGVNIKTACKYFNQWAEKISEVNQCPDIRLTSDNKSLFQDGFFHLPVRVMRVFNQQYNSQTAEKLFQAGDYELLDMEEYRNRVLARNFKPPDQQQGLKLYHFFKKSLSIRINLLKNWALITKELSIT